ncbi:TRAP transporter substrate-binding protein [Ahrensia sp. R2A130]|uniref:TRAP transporter substrate-binding protein n=1 Tax=Ahrensia sp. R2A130 TaxID=744979 RepID=UPI0001E094C0|nr:TRAP transporter substrate-binding protein [Ahrensia sp. R2A130]EFL88167.1 trap dicarboxylate transporter, dctp subunit [Ahrensia sp. R2A130]
MKPIKLALATAIGALMTAQAFAADVTLRMAHVLREGDPAFITAEAFKQEVESATEGRVAIQIFPAAQLGNNRKLFAQIQSGAIDVSFTPYNMLSEIEPALNVTAAGFMFDEWAQMKSVLEAPELGAKWSQTLLEKGGLRILSPFFYGTRNLTTTDTPVSKPSDLAGKKIRAVPNPMSLANVKGLGAAPTPVAWPETYQALRQGTVDGQENPIPVLYAAKFYEVQKYLTKTQHQMSVLPILVREASYQKLSEADRAAVASAAVKAADTGVKAMVDFTKNLEADLKAKGMTIVELSDDERAVFRDSVRKVLMEEVDGSAIPDGVIAAVEAHIGKGN